MDCLLVAFLPATVEKYKNANDDGSTKTTAYGASDNCAVTGFTV
jgi:hypothetical protein